MENKLCSFIPWTQNMGLSMVSCYGSLKIEEIVASCPKLIYAGAVLQTVDEGDVYYLYSTVAIRIFFNWRWKKTIKPS